jgi:hypothetical protein
LQAQDHAGKKAHQRNDLHGFGPDKVNLLDDGGKLLVMKDLDKGAQKKDRYSTQVAVEPDGSRPEWMKNPGKRISRFLNCDRVGRILFCGIFCHDESSFPF